MRHKKKRHSRKNKALSWQKKGYKPKPLKEKPFSVDDAGSETVKILEGGEPAEKEIEHVEHQAYHFPPFAIVIGLTLLILLAFYLMF